MSTCRSKHTAHSALRRTEDGGAGGGGCNVTGNCGNGASNGLVLAGGGCACCGGGMTHVLSDASDGGASIAAAAPPTTVLGGERPLNKSSNAACVFFFSPSAGLAAAPFGAVEPASPSSLLSSLSSSLGGSPTALSFSNPLASTKPGYRAESRSSSASAQRLAQTATLGLKMSPPVVLSGAPQTLGTPLVRGLHELTPK